MVVDGFWLLRCGSVDSFVVDAPASGDPGFREEVAKGTYAFMPKPYSAEGLSWRIRELLR